MALGIVKTADFIADEGLNSVIRPQLWLEISVRGDLISCSLWDDFGLIRPIGPMDDDSHNTRVILFLGLIQ